jgi:cell division control protein 6
MGRDVLDEVFERIAEARVFRNRDILRPDYVPETLPHREEEIRRLGSVLAQALKGTKPNNVFIYGLTGTGKTAVVRYVLKRLAAKAEELGVPFTYAYVNCRQSDTSYRVLADIAESLGLRIPFTGLSTAEVYRRMLRVLRARRMVFTVVLDEVDFLEKGRSEDLLYRLTRINGELEGGAQVSIIGITNDVKFVEGLEPRVKSSLGEEELVFPPYNALQLEDILRERAREAFYPGVLEEGVIGYCAALAAREHGDARRALDLLRVAGEIAEREGSERVTVNHVKRARIEIERDRVEEVVRTLPLHAKLVLASVLRLGGHRSVTTTGEVYSAYRSMCRAIGIEDVTQRRVSDIINELDMLGIVQARVVSRGRYGKTKLIRLGASYEAVYNALKEDYRVAPVLP